MCNYLSIPSTFKAWLDHAIITGRTADEASTVAAKPVVLVASRGGAYGLGTPREAWTSPRPA